MEQILWVHVGQAGIQIGIEFWKILIKEHGINYENMVEDELRGHVDAMFKEDNNGNLYTPRAIFCDLDPCSIDKLIQSNIGKLLSTENILADVENGCSNFAKGHYK